MAPAIRKCRGLHLCWSRSSLLSWEHHRSQRKSPPGTHDWDGMSAAEFVAREEGFVLQPYHDPVGYPTICVGHKLSSEQWADLDQWEPMTRRECMELLAVDLERFHDAVDRALHRDLTANQSTALVSLAYNIGVGAITRSELVVMLDGGAPEWRVVLEWLDWNKARVDGALTTKPALLERRRREAALFFGE